MKCKYCSNEIGALTSYYDFPVYSCKNHGDKTVVYYDRPEGLAIHIKTLKYQVCMYSTPIKDGKRFFVDEIRLDDSPLYLEILSGEHIPNITPDNFDEKLKTFLIFL